MPKIAIYNMSGSQVGEMELVDSIFDVEISEPAMHQVIVAQLANSRQGTKAALTRSEVSGGGRKPWRQKGTGRARQGSTRSPQWRHGGVVFAPKPRDFSKSVNKKMRRLAMKSAFTAKVRADEMMVIDEWKFDQLKTKEMVAALKALNLENKTTLLVVPEVDEALMRVSGNIPGVEVTLVNTLNVYDIMKYSRFVVTKAAAEKIQEVYV